MRSQVLEKMVLKRFKPQINNSLSSTYRRKKIKAIGSSAYDKTTNTLYMGEHSNDPQNSRNSVIMAFDTITFDFKGRFTCRA